MSTSEVATHGFLLGGNVVATLSSLLSFYLLSLVVQRILNVYFGPLSKFPGPKKDAFSIFPFIRTQWRGEDNTHLPELHQQYGEVVRIGPDRLSFAGDGSHWKDIYVFRKLGQPEVVKDPIFYGQNINRTPGIITADYHIHGRQRKIVSHAFSDKALKEQEPMLKTWAEKLKTKLGEQAARGEKSDMLKMLNCTTLDVMGDLTFAESLYMLDNLIRAIKYTSRFSQWFLEEAMFRMPSSRKKQMEHWSYTTDRVDRRLAKTPDRPDLWSKILEKSQGPDKLNIQEHYSIASLFMIAGTETTATALSGTLYYLLRNPKYLFDVQSELRSAFTSIEDMHLESLAKLPVLEASLKEGIRMCPPVPTGLPRVAPPSGMTVGEYFVPEGTIVHVHQLSTYRNKANFKEPYEFRPERWLGDEEFRDDRLDAFEPFSVGPRNCLGKNLAWHEMRLLLSIVLLNFNLELCPESETWADQKVYTLWEKPALMCRLTEVKAWECQTDLGTK